MVTNFKYLKCFKCGVHHIKQIIEYIKILCISVVRYILDVSLWRTCMTFRHIVGGRSGHLVLYLVALLFSKLQTFLNNNPEDNPLKSVYLTPKIALKFRRIGCRNGRLDTIAICFSHSLFRATKLVFMANYSYCRGA